MLIGIVSLTAAVATWKSVNLGSQATDTDRRSVLETVIQQKNLAKVESQLRSEEAYYARFRIDQAAADQLQKAAQGQPSGGTLEGQNLQDEAQLFEQLSKTLGNFYKSQYVVGEGSSAHFDEDRRRRDLIREDVEASQVDPDHTARAADALHHRSQRYVKFIVAFVAIVFLLTIAQLSKVSLRPFLAGIAVVLYSVVALAAFLGDKA